MLQAFTSSLWHLLLQTAPWLLLGLLVAGLIKALIPSDTVAKWLGGRGVGAILRAALVGTPLPLCSCSVLPAAVAIRRAGASRGATVSFLVATPENGVDSIALSYALLGPFMTIARLVAALLSAVFAGLLTNFVETRAEKESQSKDTSFTPKKDIDGFSCHEEASGPENIASCGCEAAANQGDSAPLPTVSLPRKLIGGLHYAVTDLYADIVVWLVIGIVFAGVVNVLVPPGELAAWGSGLPAMLAMLLVGIPMYICATASTPVAAALLLAGVSPGTILVFLLVGPATNIASFGIVRRELGSHTATCYLVAIAAGTLGLGLATDACVHAFNLDIVAETTAKPHLVPHAISLSAVAMLILMTLHLVVRKFAGVSVRNRTVS